MTMPRIKSKTERQAANRAYLAARERLNAYTPPSGDEDEEYLRLNGDVERTEQAASWWTQLKG